MTGSEQKDLPKTYKIDWDEDIDDLLQSLEISDLGAPPGRRHHAPSLAHCPPLLLLPREAALTCSWQHARYTEHAPHPDRPATPFISSVVRALPAATRHAHTMLLRKLSATCSGGRLEGDLRAREDEPPLTSH